MPSRSSTASVFWENIAAFESRRERAARSMQPTAFECRRVTLGDVVDLMKACGIETPMPARTSSAGKGRALSRCPHVFVRADLTNRFLASSSRDCDAVPAIVGKTGTTVSGDHGSSEPIETVPTHRRHARGVEQGPHAMPECDAS